MSARRRALLAVNPRSRRGRAALERGSARLRAAGLEVEVVTPRHAQELAALLRRRPDVDVAVVAGGDGTLHNAAAALVELGRPVGVLPLGTANDLARTLGIPLDLEEACDVVAGGTPRAVDLGRVHGRYFFNVASAGLSVTVTRRLTGDTKRRLGPAGYAVAAVDALRAVRSFRATIDCDGDRLEVDSVQIAVGNGRHYGGGMTVAADATIDDGLLHVYSLDPIGIGRLLASAPALRRGRHDLLESTHLRAGRRIHVETDPRRSINTDGEITSRMPATFEVVPRALEVIVPAR